MILEKDSEIIIFNWLKFKSSKIKEIYFNRKNILNHKTFSISGEIIQKPDMIIKYDLGYGIKYTAVEIKTAKDSKNIYDSNKVIRYHRNYVNGKTKYLIDNNEIKIESFLIATENSKFGYLFDKEKEGLIIDNIKTSKNKKWNEWQLKMSFEPLFEYSKTSSFFRQILSQFREEDCRKKRINAPGIGILMSEILNIKGFTNNIPYIFIMKYNTGGKKSKWGNRFIKI